MLPQELQNLFALLLEQHQQDLSSGLVTILKIVTECVPASDAASLLNVSSCKDQLVMKILSRRSLFVVGSEGTEHMLGKDDSAALVEQQDVIFALTKSSLPFILSWQSSEPR